MKRRFADKVVVAIEGSTDIPVASARAFMNEGGRLIVLRRDEESLEHARERIGNDIAEVRCDLRDPPQIFEAFSEIRRRFARIDVLFVTAEAESRGGAGTGSDEEWRRIHDTNVKGAFFCLQAALPLMQKESSAVILSTATLYGEAPLDAACNAALRAMGRSFAVELAPRGIRVNLVSLVPGNASTQQSTLASVRSWATAEEVAAAVLFLASDESSFITGIEMPIPSGSVGCPR